VPTATTVTIKHVIVIVQENRTVDNMFHGLPGANTYIPATHNVLPIYSVWDPDHDYYNFVHEYRYGFNDQETSIVRRSDVVPYFELARSGAFADEMLQSSEGESYPAHQYLIAGQSGRDGPTGTWSISQNPFSEGQILTGCNDAPAAYANQVDIDAPWPATQTNPVFPCLDYTTIFDRIDENGLSWRYYTYNATENFFTAPLGVRHLYDSGKAFAHLAVPTEMNLCNDITHNTLPSLSYVINRLSLDDHASTGTPDGPKWIATIANMIGESRYWNDTTILVTWDDWGGWYDHVKPRIISSYEYGFRVPLLVISPWVVRRGYVSHAQRDQAAILGYIEHVFGLKSLNTLDAKTDDLSDMFVPLGSVATPLPYVPVSVDVPASYFCTMPEVSPLSPEAVSTE